MNYDDAARYVTELYKGVLRRKPGEAELEYWARIAEKSRTPERLLYTFIESAEHKKITRVNGIFPNGHYYSPVVDPQTVKEYLFRERDNSVESLYGIDIDIGAMKNFILRMESTIAATPFTDEKTESNGHRYYYNNGVFGQGDAISLRAMIAARRPRTIIEIGSGFSTACMLDSIAEFGLDTKIICVEPDPERLRSVLKAEDRDRVTIIESGVQDTELEMYKSLNRNDILFIDSTHVLKTGSDVHFELFHILPCLAERVYVHFHDIQFPFEYPDNWIFERNHSWNEIYALRLFLMYNERYAIRFWGSCLARRDKEFVAGISPTFLKNPGGSIWIEKLY